MYSNRNQPRVVAEEDELPVNDELFLSPIQKYKIYGKFPYKMVIHSLLVICTSLQVLLLLSTNTNYTRAQERLFYDAFVTESDKTTYDIPRFKHLLTVGEFQNHFIRSIEKFYELPEQSLEDVSFMDEKEPDIYMKISYLKSIDNMTKREYVYRINKTMLGPLSGEHSKGEIQNFITNITKIELNYTMKTIIPNYYGDFQDCYIWNIDHFYSFLKRGHITTSINIRRNTCDNIVNNGLFQTFISRFLWLHCFVFFFAVMSLILTFKYFFNMFKLYWRVKNKYVKNLSEKELENLGFGVKKKEKDIMEKIKESYESNIKKKEKKSKVNSFFNQWSLIALIGNICQMIGSGLCIFVGDKAQDETELFLGFGCLFAFITIGKYMQTLKHCATIYNSIQKGLPNTMKIFVGVLPIFLGFTFFALCTFWRCERFASINDTIASLYSMMNGDVMLDILNDLKRGEYFLGQIFGYIFCILFVVVVMNVFLSVIGEAYVTSKMTNHNHWIYSYMKLGESENKKEDNANRDRSEDNEEQWKQYIRDTFQSIPNYMKTNEQIKEKLEDLRDTTFEELIDLKQKEQMEKNETKKKTIQNNIKMKLNTIRTRLLQLKDFDMYINNELISINKSFGKIIEKINDKKNI